MPLRRSASRRANRTDAGSGGTARYLAETGLHTVTGVDLTPEYVEVAGALNELVVLDGSVRIQQADVYRVRPPS